MITADKFMAQHKAKGKVSRLNQFEKDILQLRNNGYTLDQIIEFLNLNHIKISRSALYSFIRIKNLDSKTIDAEDQD